MFFSMDIRRLETEKSNVLDFLAKCYYNY